METAGQLQYRACGFSWHHPRVRRIGLAWLSAIAVLVSGCATAAAATGPVTVAAAAHSAWTVSRSGTTRALLDVACLTASRCEAVGAAGTILGTANGGRSWHPQRSGTRADVYRIACTAPATCYAIARPSTVLVTHNGGGTWRAHPLHIPGVGTSTTVPGCVIGPPLDPALDQPCQTGLLDIACPSAV